MVFAPLCAKAQDFSVFNQTNLVRAENHLKPLKYDRRLAQAAVFHGMDFLENHYFAHSGFIGFVKQTGYGKYGGCKIGENLAMAEMPYEVVDTWMTSPSHKANILNTSYTHLGVAVVYGNNTVYIIQMFGSC